MRILMLALGERVLRGTNLDLFVATRLLLDVLVHLVELALDHPADLIGLPAELAHELADAPRELRKTARSQDQQGRYRDQRNLT